MKKKIISMMAVFCILLTGCGNSSDNNQSNNSDKYKITYIIDSKTTVEFIEKGGFLLKPDPPIKEGYIFDEWYTEDGKIIDFFRDQEILEDLTLVAGFYEEKTEFVFSVEDAFFITGRGPVAVGVVEHGNIKIGAPVEVVSSRGKKLATVTELEYGFRESIEEANRETATTISIFLDGIDETDLVEGDMIATPSTINVHTKVKAHIYVFAAGRAAGEGRLINNTTANFLIGGVRVQGLLECDDETIETLEQDDTVIVTITFEHPRSLTEDLKFIVYDDDDIFLSPSVGRGKIIEVLEE